eukprot:262980_1
MSTHALITILVYLVLNIQNAKSQLLEIELITPSPELITLSCAAAGTCQRVSISFNFPPAEFDSLCMLCSELIVEISWNFDNVRCMLCSELIVETLFGIEPQPVPTEVTEPSEPTKPSESDPDPEPEPARRLFTSNCKSDVYVTDCTI